MPETPNDSQPKKPHAITNVLLIARREYLERVRAKSFMIMTILIPVLMGGLLFGAAYINRDLGSAKHLAVITANPAFADDLRQELTRKGESPQVDVYSPADPNVRDTLNAQLKDRSTGLDGYLITTPPTATSRGHYEWVPRSRADTVTKDRIADAIRGSLTRERLMHGGMVSGEVSNLLAPIDLKTTNSRGAFGSAYGMFLLMYFVILFYGMNVARSIIEEKTSRIFEVLLSTIKPSEMLAGKVIGVGAVGLTQVGIWIAVAAIVIKYQLLTQYAGDDIIVMPSLAQAGMFVVFFLLGYVLYSSVAAALGAMTNSEQELQQMNMFLMLPLISCSVVIMKVVTDPDSPLAKGFSYFPFTAPLIMYTRIIVGKPNPLEVVGALAGMLLAIAVVIWIASRIYRVGILMYGKKPNLPEILRWLKYS